MCVIIQLLPTKTIDDTRLFNAAANNWHSWGIIIKKDKTLVVKKSTPKEGTHSELDKIKKILKDNEKYERIIHFRHNTKGETSDENTHPFLAYKGDNRSVWMMHNGTFTNYGNGVNNPLSDTFEFNRDFLSPALSSFSGEHGFGDYTDAFFDKFLLRSGFTQAGGNNRLLLVSEDLPVSRLGDWIRFNEQGGVVHMDSAIAYYASNNDYFMEVKRGPVKEELDRKLAEERKANQVAVASTTKERKQDVYDSRTFRPKTDVFEGLQAYFGSLDLLDDSALADLGYCTNEEFLSFVQHNIEHKSPEALAIFIEHLTNRYADVYEDYVKLLAKTHAEQKVM